MQTIPWSVCRSIDHMSNFQPQLCIVYKIYILVNPSIYARCFTGWAQSTARCEVCITLDHDTSDCPSPYPTVGQGMRTADRMPQSASNTMGTVSLECRASFVAAYVNKLTHGLSARKKPTQFQQRTFQEARSQP